MAEAELKAAQAANTAANTALAALKNEKCILDTNMSTLETNKRTAVKAYDARLLEEKDDTLVTELVRLQKEKDTLLTNIFMRAQTNGPPTHCINPLTTECFSDPVWCDGQLFERKDLEEWFASGHDTNLRTQQPFINRTLFAADAILDEIRAWQLQSRKILPRRSIIKQKLTLGEGNFKVVFKGTMGALDVAIMEPKGSISRSISMIDFDKEARALLQLGEHPNIIKYLGIVVDDPGPPWLVTEFCSFGSLDKFLDPETNVSDALTSFHQRLIIQQICQGMAALAEAKIVHRDLAARNVLVFNYDKGFPHFLQVKVS